MMLDRPGPAGQRQAAPPRAHDAGRLPARRPSRRSLISLLILFVLVRRGDQLHAARSTGTSALLTDTGWFPRRERFDLRTIVVGSVDHGCRSPCSWPCRSGSARRSTCPSTRRRRVRRIVKPIIEVLAGIPSVVVGFFALNLHRARARQQRLQPAAGRQDACSPPASASASWSSRSWRRCPRTPCSAVPDSLREASYGCGARKVNTVVQGRPPGRRCRASSPPSSSPCPGRSARRWSPRWPAGYDGAGPYNGLNPLNPGLT